MEISNVTDTIKGDLKRTGRYYMDNVVFPIWAKDVLVYDHTKDKYSAHIRTEYGVRYVTLQYVPLDVQKVQTVITVFECPDE